MRRALGLSLGLLLGMPVFAGEPIDVLIHERLPYYSVDEQMNVGGLIGSLSDRVFAASGIDYRWSRTSANVQLKRIRANRSRLCAVGWFKNPEREAFARYSAPIYQDKPFVVVARRDDQRVLAHSLLDSLLADARLALGVKLGYSYGAFVDGRRETLRPRTSTTSQDFPGMLRMLAGKRFDYLFSTAEEADAALNTGQWSSLKSHTLKDIPPGNKRYILCSLRVPESDIESLNQAITRVLQGAD